MLWCLPSPRPKVVTNVCTRGFLFFGLRVKEPHAVAKFLLIIGGNVVRLLGEFHFAKMNHTVGTFDYHVQLSTGQVVLRIGVASPCGNRSRHAGNPEGIFYLPVVFHADEFKGKPLPCGNTA